MLSRRRAAAMASPSFVWALSRTRNASNSAWKVLRSTILGAPTSSFMKSFIVLSGSHLAAPALDPMPMLQIVGRREAEKSDHRHCRLLRARRKRPSRRRAAEKRDELAAFELVELHLLPRAGEFRDSITDWRRSVRGSLH